MADTTERKFVLRLSATDDTERVFKSASANARKFAREIEQRATMPPTAAGAGATVSARREAIAARDIAAQTDREIRARELSRIRHDTSRAEEQEVARAAVGGVRADLFGETVARQPIRQITRGPEEQMIRDREAQIVKSMRESSLRERIEQQAQTRLFGETIEKTPLRAINRTAEEQLARNMVADRIKARRAAKVTEAATFRADAMLLGEHEAKTLADARRKAMAAKEIEAKQGGLHEMLGSERLLNSIIKGGIVGFAGEKLAGMTGKLLEFGKAVRDGSEDWASMTQKIMESIPIVGGFAKAGANIGAMFTGEKAAIDRYNTSIENQNKLLDAQIAHREELRKLKQEADRTERGSRNAIELLGVESPSKEFIAARQARDESFKAADEKIKQAEIDARSSSDKLTQQVPALQKELNDAQKAYGKAADAINLPNLQEQHPNMSAEKLAPRLKPYIDEMNAAQAKLDSILKTKSEPDAKKLAAEQEKKTAQDLFDKTTAVERQKWNRQIEDEATAHQRRILGIEADGATRRSQLYNESEQTRFVMVGRIYDAELQAINEGTKQKLAAMEKEERAAQQARDDAAIAATRAADKTAIGYSTEVENIAKERAARAEKEYRASFTERESERGGVLTAGESAMEAANRRSKIDASKQILDFETQSLEKTTIAGQREAEKLRIQLEYAEKEKQLREQESNISLPQEIRDQIKAARANLPEQEKLDLVESARRNRGTIEVYAQATSGRGFTGQSETRAAELRKVDESAETQKRIEKSAAESAKIAAAMLDVLRQLLDKPTDAGI